MFNLQRESRLLDPTSSEHILGIASLTIPFIEHTDILRVQMACSQTRQAICLTDPEPPFIYSGYEEAFLHYSSMVHRAEFDGIVIWCKPGHCLVVGNSKLRRIQVVPLRPRSVDSFDTTLYPRVKEFQYVKKGQLLAATNHVDDKGRLCLGKNLLTAVLTYKGWNFNDAIVVSREAAERMSYRRVNIKPVKIKMGTVLNEIPKEGRYIETQKIASMRTTKPKDTVDLVKSTDTIIAEETGYYTFDYTLVSMSRHVQQTEFGQYLCDYIQKKYNDEIELLKRIAAVLGYTFSDVEEMSSRFVKRLPPILITLLDVNFPIVADAKKDNVSVVMRITIIDDIPLKLGSKLANRSGNKGVISKILENPPVIVETDERVEVIINPLGIISRMNTGQLFELHLNRAISTFARKAKNMTFDEFKSKLTELCGYLKMSDRLPNDDKQWSMLRDQIISQGGFRVRQKPFESITFDELERIMRITETPWEEELLLENGRRVKAAVGHMYWYRLVHEPDKKIFSRSIGPYTRLGQAVKGRKHGGGHRLGEMEVWALLAYEANHLLVELLSYRADNQKEKKQLLEHLYQNTIDTYRPKSNKMISAELLNILLRGCGLEFVDDEGDE